MNTHKVGLRTVELIKRILYCLDVKNVPYVSVEPVEGIDNLYMVDNIPQYKTINFLFDYDGGVIFIGKAKTSISGDGLVLDYFKARCDFSIEKLDKLQLYYYLFDDDLNKVSVFKSDTCRGAMEEFIANRLNEVNWWYENEDIAPEFFKKYKKELQEKEPVITHQMEQEFIADVEDEYLLEEINACNYTIRITDKERELQLWEQLKQTSGEE